MLSTAALLIKCSSAVRLLIYFISNIPFSMCPKAPSILNVGFHVIPQPLHASALTASHTKSRIILLRPFNFNTHLSPDNLASWNLSWRFVNKRKEMKEKFNSFFLYLYPRPVSFITSVCASVCLRVCLSVCLSVCPSFVSSSRMEQIGSQWMEFYEILYWRVLLKSASIGQFSWNSDKQFKHLTGKPEYFCENFSLHSSQNEKLFG
jgi:hypothetical protein